MLPSPDSIDLANALAVCCFEVDSAVRGRPLAELACALDADNRTIVLDFRVIGCAWDSRSFALARPVDPDTFRIAPYGWAALDMLTRPTRH